jgi:hypothetical protein
MSTPYPVIRCPAGVDRTALLGKLYRRGFDILDGWTFEQMNTGLWGDDVHEYLLMCTDADIPWVIATSDEINMQREWVRPKVLLNSPRAFLMYIDRHNIRP